MESFKLVGEERQHFGSNRAKEYRSKDLIPCVVYGGKDVRSFTVKPLEVRNLIYNHKFQTVELTVGDNAPVNVILKDVQYHPVTDKILHIDFQELVPNRAVKVSVPVEFVGNAKGIQDGGSLVPVLRKLKIKTIPEKLVDHIEADISALELGFSIKVRDLNVEEGIELLHNDSEPIAYIETPRSLKSLEASKAAEEGDEEEESEEEAED